MEVVLGATELTEIVMVVGMVATVVDAGTELDVGESIVIVVEGVEV